jgi:hypothetical protein
MPLLGVDAVFPGKPGNIVGEKGKKISWSERLALYHPKGCKLKPGLFTKKCKLFEYKTFKTGGTIILTYSKTGTC